MDVSVIIPTFNRLWCLPKTIDSCRNTQCKTEIIVVDDGSTDGTWEWLQVQTGIISIRQDNQGQTYAINNGASVASGKYIRFLDSDDFLCEGIIDKQYKTAIETNAELVCSRVDCYNMETDEIRVSPEISHWEDFLEIQLGNQYGSHFLGMLFHRRLVDAVPRRPDFALREDRMFLLEVGLLSPMMAIVEGCAGYWVQHSEQMQANYNGLKSQVTNWQYINIYKRILSKLEESNQLTQIRKNAASTVIWHVTTWIAQDHLSDAMPLYQWILKLNPSFQIPEKGLKGFLYNYLGFSFTHKILRIGRFVKYGWK